MEEFFVPCTQQEEKEVVKLLRELGYKEWEDAMIWYPGCSGIRADEDGDYYVNSEFSTTIVTLEELRKMVYLKRCGDEIDKMTKEGTLYSEWFPSLIESKLPTEPKNQIPYHVIKDLGFTEEKCYDSVHEREYGYPYKVFHRNLTDGISLDWNQVTRKARILRCDKDGNIKNEQPITSEQMLRTIVSFFKEDKQ